MQLFAMAKHGKAMAGRGFWFRFISLFRCGFYSLPCQTSSTTMGLSALLSPCSLFCCSFTASFWCMAFFIFSKVSSVTLSYLFMIPTTIAAVQGYVLVSIKLYVDAALCSLLASPVKPCTLVDNKRFSGR